MAKVRPIPEGHHTVTPHLVVEGAARAIDFYKKAFGAVEVARMPAPDGKRVMHAELKIGDSFVYLADAMPDMGGCKGPVPGAGSPVSLHLYVEDADALYNKAVSAGAKATMPLTDMFWGDRFGKLTDPFGHEWSIATHKEDVSPEEMKRRGEAACAQFAKGKK
jgi:PhnB protein